MAATPDSASAGFSDTVTSVLFQSPSAVAVAVGAVLSMFTAGLLVDIVVLPALSLTEADAVSPPPSLEKVLPPGRRR